MLGWSLASNLSKDRHGGLNLVGRFGFLYLLNRCFILLDVDWVAIVAEVYSSHHGLIACSSALEVRLVFSCKSYAIYAEVVQLK